MHSILQNASSVHKRETTQAMPRYAQLSLRLARTSPAADGTACNSSRNYEGSVATKQMVMGQAHRGAACSGPFSGTKCPEAGKRTFIICSYLGDDRAAAQDGASAHLHGYALGPAALCVRL